jgi:hypothetical protein
MVSDLKDFEYYFRRHSEELSREDNFSLEYYGIHKKRFSQI